MKLTPNQANALFFFTTAMRVARPDTRTVKQLAKLKLIRYTGTRGGCSFWEATAAGVKLSDELMATAR